MKIINIIFCIAFTSFVTHTMNEKTALTTKHNHNRFRINNVQDLPKLSFETMRQCINLMPARKRLSLPKGLTFNIATSLPAEITYKIITLMLDNDPISAEMFYTAPIWCAFKRYDDTRNMIKRSSLKKQPIGLLFKLPIQQQKEILQLATPSLSSQIQYNGPVITEEKYEQILLYDKEIQEIFSKENIVMIPDDTHDQCFKHAIKGGSIGAITGSICILIIVLIGENTSEAFQNCSKFNSPDCPLSSITISTLTIIPIMFLSIVAGVIGGIRYTRNIRQNLQPIDI